MKRLWIGLLLGLCGCQASLPPLPPLPPLPQWQGSERLDHPELGVILELRSGRQLRAAELVNELAGAPRVLIGEQHDNPDHHALQLWLLQALEQRRDQGSLLLEMLEPSQQPAVTRTRQQLAAGSEPASLAESLAWQEGWPWALYGDLVGHAVRKGYPLLAANLDRQEVMGIFRSPPPLSGRASNQSTVHQRLIEQLRESHCGMLGDDRLPGMLAVQLQRDRRMAEVLLQAPQPALLLAGNFHVRRDLGVPLHLQDLERDAQEKVVLLIPAGQPVDAHMADYVWFTAAPPEQDYCARFRQRG